MIIAVATIMIVRIIVVMKVDAGDDDGCHCDIRNDDENR